MFRSCELHRAITNRKARAIANATIALSRIENRLMSLVCMRKSAPVTLLTKKRTKGSLTEGKFRKSVDNPLWFCKSAAAEGEAGEGSMNATLLFDWCASDEARWNSCSEDPRRRRSSIRAKRGTWKSSIGMQSKIKGMTHFRVSHCLHMGFRGTWSRSITKCPNTFLSHPAFVQHRYAQPRWNTRSNQE